MRAFFNLFVAGMELGCMGSARDFRMRERLGRRHDAPPIGCSRRVRGGGSVRCRPYSACNPYPLLIEITPPHPLKLPCVRA